MGDGQGADGVGEGEGDAATGVPSWRVQAASRAGGLGAADGPRGSTTACDGLGTGDGQGDGGTISAAAPCGGRSGGSMRIGRTA